MIVSFKIMAERVRDNHALDAVWHKNHQFHHQNPQTFHLTYHTILELSRTLANPSLVL